MWSFKWRICSCIPSSPKCSSLTSHLQSITHPKSRSTSQRMMMLTHLCLQKFNHTFYRNTWQIWAVCFHHHQIYMAKSKKQRMHRQWHSWWWILQCSICKELQVQIPAVSRFISLLHCKSITSRVWCEKSERERERSLLCMLYSFDYIQNKQKKINGVYLKIWCD